MRRHDGFDRAGLEGDLILHEPSFALMNGFTPREVGLEPVAQPDESALVTPVPERPGTAIDLELGLLHAETFGLEDFRVVYEALFGASLSLLRGEIRIGAGGGAPEDVPLELRLDRTALLPIKTAPA